MKKNIVKLIPDDKWVIKDKAFEEIKVLNKKLKECHDELTEIIKAHEKKHSEAHRAMWDMIEKEVGAGKGLALDVEYEDLGFYVVKKTEKKKDKLKSLLDSLM